VEQRTTRLRGQGSPPSTTGRDEVDRSPQDFVDRCNAIIDQLDVRAVTMAGLMEAVATYLGRPNKLLFARTPREVSGITVRKETSDVVLIAVDPALLLKLHTLAHEIGHIVLEHPVDGPPVDVKALQAVAPDVPMQTIRQLVGERSLGPWHEVEAEEFARLLLGRLAHTMTAGRTRNPPHASQGLAGALDLRRRT
jgi:hypothetical protein